MKTEMYMKLQNGSDIRGIAVAGVEGENVNLTPEIAKNIGAAFADFLHEKKGVAYEDMKIGVGHDSRISAGILQEGVTVGIAYKGCTVLDCGLTSTPSMFMSTVLEGFEYTGAVMITASHLPYNRNGLKLFTNEGGLESRDIKVVLAKAAEYAATDWEAPAYTAEKADLVGAYTAHMQKLIKDDVNAENYEKPLEGLHIVVDASNGVGGYFVNVLAPLGASTEGSICMEPYGMFPNHVPNPENKQAMEFIRSAVLKEKADLGIIFDTDGDRAAVVFSNGEEVNKNSIIALMAAILAEKYPNTTVVTDSVTSDHLTTFLESIGMVHHRFKRGYKNVINESIRLNAEGIESHLAIETSGHGAVKENYFLDDGAYMSVRVICKLAKCRREGKNIEDLIATLKKPAESTEIRMKIGVDDFKAYGNQVLDDFRVFVKENDCFEMVEKNYEGVRVNYNDGEVTGWMLIRLSLHDPVIPMNFESDMEGGVEKIWSVAQTFLSKYEALSRA